MCVMFVHEQSQFVSDTLMLQRPQAHQVSGMVKAASGLLEILHQHGLIQLGANRPIMIPSMHTKHHLDTVTRNVCLLDPEEFRGHGLLTLPIGPGIGEQHNTGACPAPPVKLCGDM